MRAKSRSQRHLFGTWYVCTTNFLRYRWNKSEGEPNNVLCPCYIYLQLILIRTHQKSSDSRELTFVARTMRVTILTEVFRPRWRDIKWILAEVWRRSALTKTSTTPLLTTPRRRPKKRREISPPRPSSKIGPIPKMVRKLYDSDSSPVGINILSALR